MPDQQPHAFDEALWGLITGGGQAILATTRRDGTPHLSNMLYVPDAAARTIRISTKADTVKIGHLRRSPRAAIHVAGDSFWAYAVAEGPVSLSDVAQRPGDAACEELRTLHTVYYGQQPDDELYAALIGQRRIVIRVQVERVYGLIATGGRRPLTTNN